MSQMKKTRRPVVLTVNGKAELVVQDAKSYQQILDQLDRLEAVKAIRLGIAAAEETSQNPALADAEDYVHTLEDLPERCPVIPERGEFSFEIRHLIEWPVAETR